jgi:hypothetical protein
MTPEQLKSQMDACIRYQRLWSWFALAVMLGLPLLLFILSDRANPFLSVFLICFVGNVVLWFFMIRRSVKKYGLLCPHCGRPLTTRSPAVLSTGLCSHCERSVVDVPV